MTARQPASVDSRPAELRAAAAPDWPSARSGWWLVALLVSAYACSLLDRQILTLLIDPIRHTFGISDTHVSLLVGAAFAIFYSLLGLPLSWLADHYNRRNLIIVGMTLWCIMTALCGLATGFVTLFLARAGVAVGEAMLSPSAYSLISDHFPPERRGRAMAIYSLGPTLGTSFALIVGGAVIAQATAAGPLTLPVLGSLEPWRQVFLLVGLPGLLLAAMFFTVREPVRRGQAAAKARSIWGPLRWFLRSHWQPVLAITGSFALFTITVLSYMIWTPTMLSRSYGWDPARIGLVFGIIVLVVCSAGIYLGGWLSDRLVAQGRRDAPLLVALVGFLGCVPFIAALPFMPTPAGGVAMLGIAHLFFGLPVGLPVAALYRFTPKDLRAQIAAIYLLTVGVVAQGFGVTLVALVTDFVFADPQRLIHSVSLVGVVVCPLAALGLFLGRPAYRRACVD